MAYWLMKSEPHVYSIEDLQRDHQAPWTGVRNYQARNFMRDTMCIGDEVLFYHSSVSPPGIAGLARVCRAAYADYTALDSTSPYYDPKATQDKPIWMMVDVAYVDKFKHLITLNELKSYEELKEMLVLKKGMRLSIQPVAKAHFDFICKLRLGA